MSTTITVVTHRWATYRRPAMLPPVPIDERLSFAVDQFTGSGQVHNSRSSSKRAPATFTWTRRAIPYNTMRGAMRIAVRLGSSAGRASAMRLSHVVYFETAGIRIDLGQRHLGIGDAQQ
jgi:hypothetical protein